MAEQTAAKRGVRKRRDGKVVSVSGIKSVVVEVETRRKHPLYGKVMRVRKRFHAHDEDASARVGDAVRIEETRPISRSKRWRVVEIRERAVIV